MDNVIDDTLNIGFFWVRPSRRLALFFGALSVAWRAELAASPDAGSRAAVDQKFLWARLSTNATLAGKYVRLDRVVFAKYNRALPRDGPRDFATAQTAALHLTGLPRRAKLERLGKLYGLGPAACVRRSGSRRAGSGSCRPPPGRRRCAASPRGPRR